MKTYYKLLRKDKIHYDHTYITGINQCSHPDIGTPIYPSLIEDGKHCMDNPWSQYEIAIWPRGLSFSTFDSVWKWLDLYTDIYWIATIMVPEHQTIVDMGSGHYVTDGFIIMETIPITIYLQRIHKDIRMNVINSCRIGFCYLPNPTEEEQRIAVRRYGYLLQFIESPTETVCMEAVASDRYAFQFVPEHLKEKLKHMLSDEQRRQLQG